MIPPAPNVADCFIRRWAYKLYRMIPRFFRLLALLTALAAAHAAHAAPLVELVARKSADQWLAVVDEGNYGEAWARCAPFFRTQISREDFVKAIEMVRPPLGKVESRELLRMFYSTTLPNAPDAHYVVIQYKTKFEGRSEPVIELITPMFIGPDGEPVSVVDDPAMVEGSWQVSGYYIQ